MSKRKKKILAFSALFLAAAALATATGMHFYAIYHDAWRHGPRPAKDPAAESGAIRETMGALTRQFIEHMQQPDGKTKEATAQKTETGKAKMEETAPERNESTNPDTEEAVILSDVYTEKGKEAVFRCFHKEAASYTWEIYDLAEKDWKPAPEEAVSMGADELGREISWLKASGSEEMTVRCTLDYPKKKPETQTASLYLLKNSIEKITADDYRADPGAYVCIGDIPVTVTYKDQTEETLTGLNGLFFLTKEEKTDHKTGTAGNRVETTVTTISERSYIRTDPEEKEVQLQYNGSGDRQMETVFTIKGEDSQPPVISSVEIAPFTISNTDIPVTLTVAIDAEDNKTPNQRIDYAFVLDGTPPEEIRWMRKNSFDVEITRNGTYAACARDEAGNTAKEKIKVITVDMKPPELHASLEIPDGWCQKNEIRADARDASELQYSFRHADDAAIPEWSDSPSYTVERNGTYTVKAKDAAGNIAETEITVSNIDREAPIIKGIYIK